MRRHLLGIVAMVLLLAGTIGWLVERSTNTHAGMAAGVGMRAGLVLGALWMAYPQLVQVIRYAPKWILGLLGIAAMVLVFGRQSLVIVVPAVIILAGLQFASWIFKPLPKKKSSNPGPQPSTHRQNEKP